MLQRRIVPGIIRNLPTFQELGAALDTAGVVLSLEDARCDAATALCTLCTIANTNNNSGGANTNTNTIDAAKQCVKLASSILQHLARKWELQSVQNNDSKQDSGLDLTRNYVASLQNATQFLLLVLQQTPTVGDVDLAVHAMQLLTDWLQCIDSNAAILTRTTTTAARNNKTTNTMSDDVFKEELQAVLNNITSNCLTANLLLISSLSSSSLSSSDASSSSFSSVLEPAASRLLSILLSCMQQQGFMQQHVPGIASLAVTLMDGGGVPPQVWLALLSREVHLGNIMSTALRCMESSISSSSSKEKYAGMDTAVKTTHKLKQQQQQFTPDVVVATATAASNLALTQQQLTSAATASDSAESILLVLVQIAKEPQGGQLLVEQGVLVGMLTLARWLLAPEGGGLVDNEQQNTVNISSNGQKYNAAGHRINTSKTTLSNQTTMVDYAQAYFADGTRNPAHTAWCSILSLAGMLLATLPGHQAVEDAMLQLLVLSEQRLLLAIRPPAADWYEPLTLAMAQEAKYALFFLWTMTRLGGTWRMMLPDSLPACRRDSAALLSFLSMGQFDGLSLSGGSASVGLHQQLQMQGGEGGLGSIVCGPVSAHERAMSSKVDVRTAFALNTGWFGVLASSTSSSAGSYSWLLAERLYSCMQYALAFHLAICPEVNELENVAVSPEWVKPEALAAIQSQCLSVAECVCEANAPATTAVLLRSLIATLDSSTQLLQMESVQVDAQHEMKVQEMVLQASMVLDRR